MPAPPLVSRWSPHVDYFQAIAVSGAYMLLVLLLFCSLKFVYSFFSSSEKMVESAAVKAGESVGTGLGFALASMAPSWTMRFGDWITSEWGSGPGLKTPSPREAPLLPFLTLVAEKSPALVALVTPAMRLLIR